MKHSFEYVDPPERTQGSIQGANDNISFSGGLGMLQRRQADLFLGDIAISSERTAAVEFSFFTLADSGAFATQSPELLNEALALIRPFQSNVWPLLILTFIAVGPILYLIIILPIKLDFVKMKANGSKHIFYQEYLRELNYGYPIIRKRIATEGLFTKCIWFTTSVFLQQSKLILFIYILFK